MMAGVPHLVLLALSWALYMRSAGIHSVSTHSYTWCIFEIPIGRNFALTHGGMREKAG